MSRNARVPVPTTTLDQDSTLVVVLELSARSWLVGARVPGVGRLSRYALAPSAEALAGWLGTAKARAGAAGRTVARTDPRSADRRRRPRTRLGAVTQNGAATLELPLPDARDRGHGSADPAGYEVGRASPVPMTRSSTLDRSRGSSRLTADASYEGRRMRSGRLNLGADGIGFCPR